MESEEEIMDAVSKALRKHGYSDMSIQKIADEFPKSKSLLYHHYEGKDEILLEFIDRTLEEFEENCVRDKERNPEEEIKEKAFIGFNQDRDLAKAMTEIRAQAIRDQRYRKRFKKLSEIYRDNIEDIIQEGKNKGIFDSEIDEKRVSDHLNALNNEAMFRESLNEEISGLRKGIESILGELKL